MQSIECLYSRHNGHTNLFHVIRDEMRRASDTRIRPDSDTAITEAPEVFSSVVAGIVFIAGWTKCGEQASVDRARIS
jgi:hypothetical protein